MSSRIFVILICFLNLIFVRISYGFSEYIDETYDEVEESTTKNVSQDKSLKIVTSNTDLNCSIVENVKIMETDGNIYILSGIELFQLSLSSQEKQLKSLGILSEIEENVSDAQAIRWKNNIIFIIATSSRYNVYMSEKRANEMSGPILIQRLPIFGKHKKMLLTKSDNGLYCLIVNTFEEGEKTSMIRLYNWRESLFNQLKTKTMMGIDNVAVCESDSQSKVIIVQQEESDAAESVIQVYIIKEDQLKHKQDLHFDVNNIHFFNFDEKCFLLITPMKNGSKSTGSYLWREDRFYKHLNHKKFENITHLAVGQGLVVLRDETSLYALKNSNLDPENSLPYSSPNLLSLKIINLNEQAYIVLFFVTGKCMKINFFEVKFENIDKEKIVNVGIEQTDPKNADCITTLKTFLNNRQILLDNLKNQTQSLLYKTENLNILGKMHTIEPIKIKNGTIERVTINGTISTTPMELRNAIIHINEQLQNLKNSHNSKRVKREISNGKVDTLDVKNLIVSSNMFKDVLLKSNRTYHYNGKIITKSLNAQEVVDANGNNLKDNNFVEASRSNINLKHESIRNLKHLKVNQINGIQWNKFYNSLYLRGLKTKINGNLKVGPKFHIKHLEANQINDIPVKNLLTLHSNQEVNSNFIISRFFATEIKANKINGLDFGKDLATIAENNVIDSQIKIQKCYITNNLTLSEEEDEVLSRHIVGTKIDDLSQIYNGRVLIKGSLKLKNIILESTESVIKVAGKIFEPNITNTHWLKSVDQNFGHVLFQHPIKTPQIFANNIFDHPSSDFLLINENPTSSLNLIIKSAEVLGSISTSAKSVSKLSRISQDYIKRNEITTIKGKKIFKGELLVDDFLCTDMRHPSITDLLLKSNLKELILLATKQFEKLIIEGDLRTPSDSIAIQYLNGRDLMDFRENAITINNPIRLGTVRFKDLKANEIKIDKIGSIGSNQFIGMFENTVGNHGMIKNVHVNGSVAFTGNLRVETINGININQYLSEVVTIKSNGEIKGIKQFSKGLKCQSIYTNSINTISLKDWFTNALNKDIDQTITGAWTFDNLKADKIEVSMINGVWTDQLIDVRNEFIKINSDVSITSSDVYGSLYGQMPCDITRIEMAIQHLSNKASWKFIEVHGNTEWPINSGSYMDQILQNAVTTNTDQEINAEVIFSSEVLVKSLSATGLVNNLNVFEMHKDALKKSGDFQMVLGHKKFQSPTTIKNVITEGDLYLPIINGVNIVELNNSIFRTIEGSIISGLKSFKIPPLISEMHVKGLVHGVNPTDIVCANNQKVLPAVSFLKSITIENNLKIKENINNLSFDYFLKNRIRKTGKIQEVHGVLTFQHLITSGDAKIPSINNILPEDVVTTSSDALQEITGHKTVDGQMSIKGPSMISTVNDKNLIEMYTRSILLNQNEKIPRLEPINSVILKKGVNVDNSINDVNIETLNNWTPQSIDDLGSAWLTTQNTVLDAHTLTDQNSQKKTKMVMYLEFASNLEIINEKVAKDFTFLTKTKSPGESCGLEHRCECVAQYGVRISPVYKIYINRRQHHHRILMGKSENCSVLVETLFPNPCKKDEKLPASKITWKIGNGENQKIKMNDFILGVRLMDHKGSTMLLMNHFNGTVTISQLNAATENWTPVSAIHGQSINIELINWNSNRILVIFSEPVDHHTHGMVHFYSYENEDFIPIQSISGDYDLYGSIGDEKEFMLFLGKTGTNTVAIFKGYHEKMKLKQFVPLQRLVFESSVEDFVVFEIDDSSFLATATNSGNFYMHKYNHVEGWITATYGHFEGIEAIMPFSYYGKTYLFVSSPNSATAMVVYHQLV